MFCVVLFCLNVNVSAIQNAARMPGRDALHWFICERNAIWQPKKKSRWLDSRSSHTQVTPRPICLQRSMLLARVILRGRAAAQGCQRCAHRCPRHADQAAFAGGRRWRDGDDLHHGSRSGHSHDHYDPGEADPLYHRCLQAHRRARGQARLTSPHNQVPFQKLCRRLATGLFLFKTLVCWPRSGQL